MTTMQVSSKNSTTAVAPGVNLVNPRDVGGNVLLLDVRTPDEFEAAHIEGAVLHPLPGLNAQAVARLAEGKSASVLICRTGKRARQAAERLAANGLTSLTVLDGGIQAWKEAGLPLVRGQKAISLERQVRIGAGALVAIGVALGFFVHPRWLILPAFVGLGLVFAGVTDFCGMGLLLARMPWNKRRKPDTRQKA
jgi:rhodanese-related sulfurtransferase